ncbi:MAG: SDR family NAD(P)-dependent oxidoreductase [Solirubrobacterales bacterium]|nr:SDR family NAD(P)-dependent oxidoreductase [Solirubrobacterales bacterium]
MSKPPKAGLADQLLDLAIAPGFSKLGFAARQRGFAPLPDATGREVVITGASAGLGRAAARMCSAAGASVTMVSRDRGRASEALAEVQAASIGGEVRFEKCDMSVLSDVRRLASILGSTLDRIDALVLNAGVLLHERSLTAEGIETAWATNVVGPYLLEELALPQLQTANGRVVMVTSGGAYSEGIALPDSDLVGDGYDGAAVYARTKRAQIALAQLEAERQPSRGITAHAVHPGWADTPGVQTSLPTFRKLTRPFLRSADEGADSIAWLALAPEAVTSPGLLWHDRKPRPRNRIPGQADTEIQRLELDAEIRRLAGLTVQPPGRG